MQINVECALSLPVHVIMPFWDKHNKLTMTRILYTTLLYLALPFILLRLLWRSLRAPAYRHRIRERFGLVTPTSIDIWLHAVSVGEVIAATPLVKQLQRQFPKSTIAITCMTPTGSRQIVANFGDTVVHHYLPYDYPFAIKRLLRRWSPKLLIIMETEMWPNLLYHTARRRTPILLANARLSPKSYAGYRWIRWLTKPMLSHITLLAAQAKADAMRYHRLGLATDKIVVTGNIKFDLIIPTGLTDQANQLRHTWGSTRPVWIAASTHKGEDELILAAFADIKRQIPDMLLIIVPRHPERFTDVTQLCQKSQWQVTKRSQMQQVNPTTDILIGDTMGEMLLFYAASDVALVGGSLIPHGGHNLLEPAALKLPIISGSHTFNFTAIHRLLAQMDAITIVHTAQELAEHVVLLVQDTVTSHTMGARAQQVVRANQGALAQHINLIHHLMTS
jgi:3-deoxy-D-manno-octulosonic-acid transferase